MMLPLPSPHSLWRSLALILICLLPLCQGRAQSADLITGSLQYGIPVGEVGAQDVSVPISIFYHGNSLTVAEGEGDCGMGWSLSAGGAITRMVRGLPDELDATRQGWTKIGSNYSSIQSFSPAGDDVLTTCSDESSDFNFLAALGYTVDTEPDLFYFQAPGIGGQFILNSSGTPQLLNLQDITVSNFSADSFSIKTNQGIVYSFTSIETTIREAVGTSEFRDYQLYRGWETSFTSRWLLTRMQSTATGATVKFIYTLLPEAMYNTYREDSAYHFQDRFQPKRIRKIEVNSYKAEFNWANNVLARVTVRDTLTGNSKQFEMYYQTFRDYKYNASQYKFPVSKTFLQKVREVGANCSPYSSYEFNYAFVDWSKSALAKPWKKNHKQDYFGYYNGVSTNKNVPTVYFYNSESDARRVRVTAISGVTASNTITGQDRTVNTDSSRFGALTKVVTPGGGVIDITWENNVYYDSATFENLTGGGLRVKKISMNGSDVAFGKPTDVFSASRAVTRSYEYLESDGTKSSGKLLSPLAYGYYLHTGYTRTATHRGDPPEIMYSRVRETIDTLGSTVYEFSIPGVYPQTQKYEWKATKVRIARSANANCNCANFKNGYYAFPFPPSTNFGHRRGFLKAVYQYSNGGTLVRKREMTALQLPASPPSPYKAIRFERLTAGNINAIYYGIYEILTGRGQVVASETVTEYPESGATPMVTTTQYSYNSNNMLQQVTQTLVDGTTTTKKFRYAKDYVFTSAPSSTDTAAVALKELNDTNRHGSLVEQTTRVTPSGGSAVLTDASLIVYRKANGKTFPYYLKGVNTGVDVTESTLSGGNSLTVDADYFTVRTFKEYDGSGRPVWEFDKNKNKLVHSYASLYGHEVATFANIKSAQAVTEGFETPSSAGLNLIAGSPSYPAGWTGAKSIQMATSVTLESGTLSKGNTSKYRLSCWAKSATGATLYFKAYTGTTTDIGSLTVNSSNQWQYYESTVSAPGSISSFTLRVTSSASVTVDDIVFIPEEGRVAMKTVNPLIGITSATDDRGNSVTYAYDVQGRKTGTFDRKRNLVEKNEYAQQKQLTAEVVAGFTTTAPYYVTSTSLTFNATNFCNEQNRTFSWNVDGSVQSTTSSLTTSFVAPGLHNISLTVTRNGTSKTFDQDLCVGLGGSPDITAQDANSNVYEQGFVANCNTPPITFTANDVPPSGGGCTTTITWLAVNYVWYLDHWEPSYSQSLGTGSSITYTPSFATTVQARVQISCTAGSDMQCLGDQQAYFILGFNVGWETVNCN